MDLDKCRTCYTNLESNDLYLKLNVINKNSTLSLADKLRKLVGNIMDLEEADKHLICMQCSIHLETAYTFYTTCLETEKKFKKRITTKRNSNEDKKEEMVCETCNLHFSSKNIFDLHMKLMHFKKQPVYKEVVNDINIRVAKNNKPLLEMVFLQTDRAQRKRGSLEVSREEPEVKRRRLASIKSEEFTKALHIDGRKIKNRCIDFPRNKDGRFKPKSEPKTREDEKLPKRTSKQLNPNKITSTVPTAAQDVKPIAIKKEVQGTKEEIKRYCKFCNKFFASNEKFITHARITHPDRCQCCPLCNRFYTNKKLHKKQYGCDLFKYRTQNFTISEVLSEKLQDTGRTIYYLRSEKDLPICLICREVYPTVKCLEAHLTADHTMEIRCFICCKSFTAISYCSHMGRGCSKLIAKNSYNLTSDGECICPICNKVFGNETALKGHLVYHLYQKLQCPDCNEYFAQIASYGQHVVKGVCKKRKNKSPPTKDSTLKKAMFIECADECDVNVENTTSSQEDPLKEAVPLEAPPPITESQEKNVKVEPTELLDHTGFLSVDDSLSNDNAESSPAKYMNITSVNDEIVVDTPEFIYVVQNIDDQSSE